MSDDNIEKLNIGERVARIDPQNLKFNEATLNEYIQKEAGYYDNFGSHLAMAEKLLQREEMLHEKMYSDRFAEAKDNGASDKKAEAIAKGDSEVVILKENIIEAKYKVQRLRRHLYAWDKNHDNAQSLGHMLRKEMDKLNAEIFSRNKQFDYDVSQDHRGSVSKEEESSSFESGSFEELDKGNLY